MLPPLRAWVRVKICGITSAADARLAVEAGADAIGLVFATSPRRLTIEQARDILAAVPPLVVAVGVFRDQSLDEVFDTVEALGLHTVQLHGREPPSDACALEAAGLAVLRSVTIRDEGVGPYDPAGAAALLADPGAGDGRSAGWDVAARHAWPLPLILAGGLDEENVEEAIAKVRPYAVDVSSGVEAAPGRKDPGKVRRFIEVVRAGGER